MKRYKIIISLAAIICGLMIACDNTDYSNKAPFDNMVYIKEASNSNSERVTFRNTLNEQKRAFSAKLTYPAGKDIVVKLKADPELINEFNARHGTDYGMLDSKYYSLSNSELIIKAEKSESLIDTIYFNNLLDLEIDKTYLVPLTISETSGGVHLLNGSRQPERQLSGSAYFPRRREKCLSERIRSDYHGSTGICRGLYIQRTKQYGRCIGYQYDHGSRTAFLNAYR